MKKQQKTMSSELLSMVAERMRVIGDPLRLHVLQRLEKGEMSVTELTQLVGTSQPNLSKHLKILKDDGIVTRRQEKNTAYYSISDPFVFELCDLVCNSLEGQLNDRVTALKGR